MIEPTATELWHAPSRQFVEAQIVTLTPRMIEEEVMGNWWSDPNLASDFVEEPIDLRWDWLDVVIEFAGRILASQKISIFSGGHVQGAMQISTEPVNSIMEPGMRTLFVERLFTAPRNRPELRTDKQPYLLGVGSELLTWAAWSSRMQGFNGRLRLDGSPGFLSSYAKRGLQRLDLEPILFEGVTYTPMELDVAGADALLSAW
jgi:hypothetical protein